MMKRRAFGMLLSLCLVLALIPAAAFAELTLTVPYTINVVKGGSAEPGYAEFRVQLIENTGEDWRSKGDVSIACPFVKTNGVDDYAGEVIITGTLVELTKLEEGVFVRQWNMGKDGWEYDPAVWYVKVVPKGSGDSVEGVTYAIYPTKSEETGDGGWRYIPTGEMKDKMTFTNKYTKFATEVTPDPDDASSDANVSALPKTGDSSNLTGWLILLAVSAAAVAGAVVYGRRRKNTRE